MTLHRPGSYRALNRAAVRSCTNRPVMAVRTPKTTPIRGPGHPPNPPRTDQNSGSNGAPTHRAGAAGQPSGSAGSLASEVVLDPDDVVQFGGRDLDELDVPVDRLVAMDPAHRDVAMLPRLEV